MAGSDALLDLLGAVYDAATDPREWPRFLRTLADAVGCSAVGLFPMDAQSASSRVTHAHGHDPEAIARYDAHYGRPDVNAYAMNLKPGQLVPGAVLRAEAICPDRLLVRTEYWNDWLRPQQLGAGGFGILAGPGGGLLILSVARDRGLGALSTDELMVLTTIVPHLQRAITMQAQLERLQSEGDAAIASLDHLPAGVILLDELARPLLVNRSARTLIDANDGLAVARDGLTALDPGTTERLHRMIGAAIDTTLGRGVDGGDALALPRADGKPPLHASVAPVGRYHYRIGVRFAAAMVFVADPARVVEPADVLRRLYGLTAAESTLATLLVNGRSPEEAATELGVSIHTVRTQLKHVLGKTGARRQAELVRLVLLGPAGIAVGA
jgi:DNA-binding CsgD family transcriptional regulator